MRNVSLVLALLTVAWHPRSAFAQAPKADATQETSQVSAADQPKLEEVLRQMADYIGSLPAFSCRLELVVRIQARGMDNQMTTKMDLRLERPNHLALLLKEGMMGMTLVSDGKQLYQYLPMLNRYTVRDAPESFAEFSDERGPMEAAMAGLPIRMIPSDGESLYKALLDGVTKSEYLGVENVGDVRCHHCRFSQEQFNWEIWIETGKRPVVHKIVPDFSKQFADAEGMLKDAKLEYSAVLSDWNVSPKFTDADFAFNPPAEAQKVDSLLEGMTDVHEGPHPLLGQPAPPFKTVSLKEKPIDLATHLGKNVVMLDFWATWCGPCVQAMPEVEGVAKKFADRGLVFYAVNVKEDTETIKDFLKSRELDVPVALDPDGAVAQQYHADGIPQTVLIGKDGKVQVVHVGFSPTLAEELTQEIEELLAGKDLASAELAAAEKPSDNNSGQPPENANDADPKQ